MAAISVTRALAERKALDGQITRASGSKRVSVTVLRLSVFRVKPQRTPLRCTKPTSIASRV
jgi:hypothetical protein